MLHATSRGDGRTPSRAIRLLLGPVVLAAGCGAGPAAPAPSAVQELGSSLRILGEPVIDLTRGETRALQVEERGGTGAIVTQPLTAYSWTSSASDTVTVGANGTLLARANYGGATITARSPAGRTATVHVWVQPPSHLPSQYKITLMFAPDVPSGWHSSFQTAAAIVEKVIRGALPPVVLDGIAHPACRAHPGEPPIPALTGTETGTIVYVDRRSGFGAATGGPCLQRPQPRPTTIFGRITIPRGDADPGRPPVLLSLHEIGHALGLVGLSLDGPPPGFDPSTRRHFGIFTIEGYRRTFGQTVPFVQADGYHWDFGGDAMGTGAPATWFTKVTAGALMDMGYPAAWYGAH